MALEALSSNEFLNFIMYDSITGGCSTHHSSSLLNLIDIHGDLEQEDHHHHHHSNDADAVALVPPEPSSDRARKKRRRRSRVCKNKEEAETQRMTHIAVERNRRKQMNEHLAVLRSLMPDSYVQRGDQASIVGGAIEFVKELEHTLQTLEAKKLKLGGLGNCNNDVRPFAEFFSYPQFRSGKHRSQSKAGVADIEVTLIETHASIRILSHARVRRQLSKMAAAFQTLLLTVLHLSLTTLDSLVLYSISAKVEEGCQLNSADDIANAVHHMLRIIEEEAILCR